jgi:hypothetical protein
MQAGWLDDITNWLREQLEKLWNSFVELMGDFAVWMVDAVLDLFATIIEAIPVPDFIANYSICALLANAGPTVAWALDTFKIAEGLGLLAAGFGFRMLRKLLTLFQW